MLRRHGLEGGLGRVIEYYGPALTHLSAMDRHVIANMGAELGATTTVFPSDLRTREFLRSVGREDDWRPITAEPDADYDVHDEIDLSSLQPLIAEPSSPGNVVAVREVAGAEGFDAALQALETAADLAHDGERGNADRHCERGLNALSLETIAQRCGGDPPASGVRHFFSRRDFFS